MWDAIVIGSGIGGLGAAAALGKRGKRVLLLEQHSVAGGQTQTFHRHDWVFATGVHYVGGVGPQRGREGQFGRLLAWLSDGALQFAPCANPYDIVRLPGFEFGIAHPEAAYKAALMARFAGESAQIDRWFEACHAARQAAVALIAMHNLPPWMAWGLRLLRASQGEAWAKRTLADELSRIDHPQLRAVLGARWGDYGAPPGTAPFAEHALVTGSFNSGAYFPVGGSARFAQTLLPALRSAGGELRTSAKVHRILLEDGRVTGVEVAQDGVLRTERTSHVISDIGMVNTLACIDAGEAQAWRDKASELEPSPGFVALYIGLEGDIAAAGATSANYWIYESEDIDRLWQQPADEDAPGLFVSFPSLKDPSWRGPPTAEVLTFVDPAVFAPWLSGQPGESGDYAAFKAWVADRLLAQFKRHFPTLAPLVRFHEAATPLTQQRFVCAAGGSMYGIEMTIKRMGSDAVRLRTPVPGLALAGQDVAGPGVGPSLMTGVMAAATVDAGVLRELVR